MREMYSGRTEKKTHAQPTKAAKPTVMPVLKNMSVSVSQIENGFLVNQSGEHKGKYVNRTIYSPTNPIKVTSPKVKFGKK